MRNGIFGFKARKIQREPKRKEGEGEGKMMMMMMMMVMCADEADSFTAVLHIIIICKRSRKARRGLLHHPSE